MKKKLVLLLVLVCLVAVSPANAAKCMADYMDALNACYPKEFWDRQVCEIDATITYVGCLREALLF